MSRFKDPGFIFELGFVLAIYFAFIFVYWLFSGVFGFVLTDYFATAIVVTVLVSITVFVFYRAYVRREVFAFFIGFTVIGMLLFSLSTVIALPYTTTESHTYTISGNLYNGTLIISSYESKNVSLGSFWGIFLRANGTVVQLTLSSTRLLRVRLYYRAVASDNTEKLALDQNIGFLSNDFTTYWNFLYWTPESPVVGGPSWIDLREEEYWITVVLENSEPVNAQVIFKMDYYDFQHTSTRDVVNYHLVIEPDFKYLGFGLIIAAVIIEFWEWTKSKSIKPPTSKH